MDTYPQTHIGEGENISANTAKNSWLIRDNLWRTNSRHRTAFVTSIIPLSLPLSYRFRQTRFSSISWESTNSHIFPLFPFFPSFPSFPNIPLFPPIPQKPPFFFVVNDNIPRASPRGFFDELSSPLFELIPLAVIEIIRASARLSVPPALREYCSVVACHL